MRQGINDMRDQVEAAAEKEFWQILDRSSRLIHKQGESVRKEAASFLEPREESVKPWETFI